MPITLGAGVQLGSGISINTNTILNTAAVYYSIQYATDGLSNGTNITSLTNLGTLGSSYDAASAGSVPVVATQNSVKVLSFSGSVAGYNLSSVLDMSTGSMFFVGYQTANRLIAWGGQGATYSTCFFGYSTNNGTGVLFRNTADGGVDFSGLTSVSGLKVFGIVKSGGTVTYYDNSTSGTVTSASGTFGFNAVGYRGGYGGQYSTGYLGDVAYWNTALSSGNAATVVTTLKSIYNIS